MTQTLKDAEKNHWVYRMPERWIPYLQLSRLDRPIGYWLLTLPGWIALSFAGLSHGLQLSDLKWALLILIGAIAMRGAGCTYNDIVDRDLDAQVERTALRPIPAGTVTPKQAWLWLFGQCFLGLMVLLLLPRFTQIIALCSIPLVAAYPFMKRITWWPQVWLGLTLNWAALVAYAAKTGEISPSAIALYIALIFWTIGYDTIYACQDIEDDAMVGIKSTARRFGKHVKIGIAISYVMFIGIAGFGWANSENFESEPCGGIRFNPWKWGEMPTTFNPAIYFLLIFPALHLLWQVWKLEPSNASKALRLFKSNFWVGLLVVVSLAWIPLLDQIIN